jgi:hypothetical protein
MTNTQTAYVVGLKLIATCERFKGKMHTREFIHCFPTSDAKEAKRLAKQIWEAKHFFDNSRCKVSYVTLNTEGLS